MRIRPQLAQKLAKDSEKEMDKVTQDWCPGPRERQRSCDSNAELERIFSIQNAPEHRSKTQQQDTRQRRSRTRKSFILASVAPSGKETGREVVSHHRKSRGATILRTVILLAGYRGHVQPSRGNNAQKPRRSPLKFPPVGL